MTVRLSRMAGWIRWGGWAAALLGFGAGVVVLMLWLAGWFSPKVPLGLPSARGEAPPAAGRTVRVEAVAPPRCEWAVGTVRAVHETSIGSKLLARVVEVNIKAGQKVREGDVLVRLDDSDLRARLNQANAAVNSAEAVRVQAAGDEKRYAQLVKTRTISQQDYDKAVAALHTAEADLLRLKAAVNEVQAALDSATIRSPMNATVIDKKVDVGDMVAPGQLLATLFDPERMQLVASVRESLADHLQIGRDIGVKVGRIDKVCYGRVSEIVPEAQSASRTFQVKVTGPCPPGVYSGMFGRIQIPLEKQAMLVIPRRAVRTVGQLELVEVVEKGGTGRRAVRTGRPLADEEVKLFPNLLQAEPYVEVLSGLSEGEEVMLPAASETAQEAPHG
jgi:membrane fusion protein, multidrug efflux system